MIEVRDAHDLQLADLVKQAQQMCERDRVASARHRHDDTRRRRRELVPANGATNAIKQHAGRTGRAALPSESQFRSAGGRIRTVDPALMRRVLSPTELPRQTELRILAYGAVHVMSMASP